MKSLNPPNWMNVDDAYGDETVPIPSYLFYDGSIQLFFDEGPHVYYRFKDSGERENIDGVTTVLNVISKPYLVPWATKLCIETLKTKMLDNAGRVVEFSTEELFSWFEEAKNKHKDHLETAGDIGKIAHDCLEQNIKRAIRESGGVVDRLEGLPENEQARNCVLAAFEWMKAHNVRFLHTERKVYSLLYNVAGTLDGDAVVDSCSDPFCRGCCGRVFRDRRAIIDWKSSNQLSDSYAYQTALYLFAQVEEFGHYIPDRWILRLGKTSGDFEAWYLPDEYFEYDLEAFLAALKLYRSLKEIEARRGKDKKEFNQKVKVQQKRLKDEAKAAQKAQDKLAKAQAKEEASRAKKVAQDAKKALYKQLRAGGKSVTEAKYMAGIDPPKEDKTWVLDQLAKEAMRIMQRMGFRDANGDVPEFYRNDTDSTQGEKR